MIRFILASFFSVTALAAPSEVEIWFLSASKTAQLEKFIQERPIIFYSRTAELQCQQMGDYCFDPQYGLYQKDDAFGDQVDVGKIEKDGPSIPSGKSVERELINCDKNNFFDVFCGKARKESAQTAKLSVWIDTSSSMKEFDYPAKEGGCFRKSFLKRLDDACGFNQKVNVMVFDTSIKQAGSMEQVCDNRGLNDYKRLIDWIERADAKKLIIITDVYELHKEFSDYIESINGKLRGDKDPLTASELVELSDQLAKSCK